MQHNSACSPARSKPLRHPIESLCCIPARGRCRPANRPASSLPHCRGVGPKREPRPRGRLGDNPEAPRRATRLPKSPRRDRSPRSLGRCFARSTGWSLAGSLQAPSVGGLSSHAMPTAPRAPPPAAPFGRQRERGVAGADDCSGHRVVRHERLLSAVADEAEQPHVASALAAASQWRSTSRSRPPRRRHGLGPVRLLQRPADAAVRRCPRDDCSSSAPAVLGHAPTIGWRRRTATARRRLLDLPAWGACRAAPRSRRLRRVPHGDWVRPLRPSDQRHGHVPHTRP